MLTVFGNASYGIYGIYQGGVGPAIHDWGLGS